MVNEEQDEAYITVRNIKRMDSEIFRKHLVVRHGDNLGGWNGLGPFASEYTETCWRAYHEAIHRLALQQDMDHDHGR
jgi:hypothetical protein